MPSASSPDGLFMKAAKRALGGGIPGALAMLLQVVLLMWLRTAMNYQHSGCQLPCTPSADSCAFTPELSAVLGKSSVSGSFPNGRAPFKDVTGESCSTPDSLRTLWAQGGVPRFYKGLNWALFSSPISRFGDTAANEGVKALLEGQGYPVSLVTMGASVSAGAVRVLLTPMDYFKTNLQGGARAEELYKKIEEKGYLILFDGALGNWVGNTVGHYPWFMTYNLLNAHLSTPTGNLAGLCRSAVIGLASSFVSDCTSNPIRVLKTQVQSPDKVLEQTFKQECEGRGAVWGQICPYLKAGSHVIEEEGSIPKAWIRGLGIKIISNAVSSVLFTILWKYLMEWYNPKKPGGAKKD